MTCERPSAEAIQACIKNISRPYVSGPRIAFLNFNFFPLIGGALADIPVHAPWPCNVFFLTSVKAGNEADTVTFHFVPDGHQRTILNMAGTEAVIPLTSNLTTGPVYRTFIRLAKPVQDFFLDIGTEVGQGPTFTLACAEDDALALRSGTYRSF